MTKRRWQKRREWVRVGVSPEQTLEMRKFCLENFEKDAWEKSRLRYYFKNTEDATLFCLAFDTKSKRTPSDRKD